MQYIVLLFFSRNYIKFFQFDIISKPGILFRIIIKFVYNIIIKIKLISKEKYIIYIY